MWPQKKKESTCNKKVKEKRKEIIVQHIANKPNSKKKKTEELLYKSL